MLDLIASRLWLRPVPREVDGDEVIIRAVMSPYHLDGNRKSITAELFTSPRDKDEVSVYRYPVVPLTVAKIDAKLFVERPNDSQPKIFNGLAVVRVSKVRAAGFQVSDSREEFLGHADIVCGVVQKKGVALPPDVRAELKKRLQTLVNATVYVRDSRPALPMWVNGLPIC